MNPLRLGGGVNFAALPETGSPSQALTRQTPPFVAARHLPPARGKSFLKGRALGSPRKLHLFAKASPFGRGGFAQQRRRGRGRLAGGLVFFRKTQKRGEGTSPVSPLGFRYDSGLGAGLDKTTRKNDVAFVRASLFSSISSGCQLKLQRLFPRVRTRGNTQDLSVIFGQFFLGTTRSSSRLGNGKVKLFSPGLHIESSVIDSHTLFLISTNGNLQCPTDTNNVLGDHNLRCSAICRASHRTISSFQVSLNGTRLGLRTGIFTKVNGNRKRPSITFRNLVKDSGVPGTNRRTSTLILDLLRTHIRRRSRRVSRKHRHCTHGHRQRGCKEQGGGLFH